MKLLRIVFFAVAVPFTGFSQQKPMRLWFTKPAYQPAVFSYQAPEFTGAYQLDGIFGSTAVKTRHMVWVMTGKKAITATRTAPNELIFSTKSGGIYTIVPE